MRKLLILLALFVSVFPSSVCFSGPPERWDVRIQSSAPHNLDIWHGESVDFRPRFFSYGAPWAISTDATVTLYWSTNNFATTPWATNGVVMADTGRVTVTWSPACDSGASAYQYFVGVSEPSGLLYRARGTIRMQTSPGFTPSTAPLPVWDGWTNSYIYATYAALASGLTAGSNYAAQVSAASSNGAIAVSAAALASGLTAGSNYAAQVSAASSNGAIAVSAAALGAGLTAVSNLLVIATTNAQAIATSHVARADNPHSVTAAQAGAVGTNDARYLAALTNAAEFSTPAQTETARTNAVDPAYRAASNTLATGAALGATALQPTGNATGLTNFPASLVSTNDARYLAALTNAWQNPASATNWTWTSDGKQSTLTSYIADESTVVIPDMLDGLPVTTLGTLLFNGKHMVGISGGRYVIFVGASVFYGCNQLKSIALPIVESVGTACFTGCGALTNATLPLVVSVGTSAFDSCATLTSVSMGKNAPAETGDCYVDSLAVTNYITNPQATGWGATWNGRPVVRLPVYADEYWRLGTSLTTLLAAKQDTVAGTIVTNGGSGASLTGITAAQVGAVSNTAAGIAAAGGVTNNGVTGTDLGGSVFSNGLVTTVGTAFTAAGTSAVQNVASLPYQPWTATLAPPPSLGTNLLKFADGIQPLLVCTGAQTIGVGPTNGWSQGGINRLTLALWAGSFAITIHSNAFTRWGTSISLSTTRTNHLMYRGNGTNDWTIYQLP